MKEAGVQPSCIFSLPGVSLLTLCIDVLHAVDLGVAQDAIGNILWEFLRSYAEGRNTKEKLAFLWTKLKAHYHALKTTNRLQDITQEMIKQDKKGQS